MKWKTVIEPAGFEHYQVSSCGKVRNSLSGRTLRPYLTDRGYYFIRLNAKNKSLNMRVHRLVAFQWVRKVYGKDHINHKDGNKINNHYKNLEWCTQTENNRHSRKYGLNKSKGELCATSKLTAKQVQEIKDSFGTMTFASLGRMYKISEAQIRAIYTGISWRDENFKMPKGKYRVDVKRSKDIEKIRAKIGGG